MPSHPIADGWPRRGGERPAGRQSRRLHARVRRGWPTLPLAGARRARLGSGVADEFRDCGAEGVECQAAGAMALSDIHPDRQR